MDAPPLLNDYQVHPTMSLHTVRATNDGYLDAIAEPTARPFTPSVFASYKPEPAPPPPIVVLDWTAAAQQYSSLPLNAFLGPRHSTQYETSPLAPSHTMPSPHDTLSYSSNCSDGGYSRRGTSYSGASPSFDNTSFDDDIMQEQDDDADADVVQLHAPVPQSAQFVFPAFPSGSTPEPGVLQPIGSSLSGETGDVLDSQYCGAGSLDPVSGVFSRAEAPTRIRTAKACEKCRVRKAKCTGTTPACGRCLHRGLKCEYAAEPRNRGPNKSSRKNSVTEVSTPQARRKASQMPAKSALTVEDHASRRQSVADFRLHSLSAQVQAPLPATTFNSSSFGPLTLVQRRMSKPSNLRMVTTGNPNFQRGSTSSPQRSSSCSSVESSVPDGMPISAPAHQTTFAPVEQAGAGNLADPSMFVDPTHSTGALTEASAISTNANDYLDYLHNQLRPQLARMRVNSYGSTASGNSFGSVQSDSSLEYPPYDFGSDYTNNALYTTAGASSGSCSPSPITPAFNSKFGVLNVGTVDDVFLPAPPADNATPYGTQEGDEQADMSIVLGEWIKTPNQDGNGFLTVDYS